MPFFSDYHIAVLTIAGIYIIVALGLNIITGYAGLFHVGIMAYTGAGAYASAFLTAKLGFSFWAALPLSLLIAVAMAVLTGLPALRVREDFLAVVTIGVAFVFESLLVRLPYFGGPIGIVDLPRPRVFGETLGAASYLLLVLIAVVIVVEINRRVANSWMGLAWESLREDETAAEVAGVNTARFKILAFAVGGLFCGLGGVLYAHFIKFVSPYDFGFLPSVWILVMIVFGGMGTIRGPIIGAAILGTSPELFRFVQEWRYFVYGGLLVFMMLFQPSGLLGAESRVWRGIVSLLRLAPFARRLEAKSRVDV